MVKLHMVAIWILKKTKQQQTNGFSPGVRGKVIFYCISFPHGVDAVRAGVFVMDFIVGVTCRSKVRGQG